MLLGDKPGERPLTFLDHSDEGVEGYGANMRLELRRLACQISLMVLPRCLGVVGVQLVYETIHVRYETAKFAGQIFAGRHHPVANAKASPRRLRFVGMFGAPHRR